MDSLQIMLIDLGTIGMGVVFLASCIVDLKTKAQIFELMRQRKVPFPKFCYVGGILWKALTGLGLIFDVFTFTCALLLALYIFLANLVFNNFWSAPAERRGFSLYLFLIHLAICFGLIIVAGVFYL